MQNNSQFSTINSQLKFGSKVINYSLQYSERKTLGITVTPEMDVLVKAPMGSKHEDIEKVLFKRAPWILKQISFFLGFFPKLSPKRFVSGESHLYMGRQYQLKVVVAESESVKLNGRFIVVSCKDKSRAEMLLEKWYNEHAQRKFAEYSERLTKLFAMYNVTPKEIKIRKMQTRWGSCTAKGRIILNSELIKAPKGCIEYVIVHELCHLVHFAHNKKFIELQTQIMPTWEKWKDRLERVMA